jgi:hypothetical protein
MVFTCTLRRRKESKHISSRRGEHSGKVQRLTLRLDKLCNTAICIVLVSSAHNLFFFVFVFMNMDCSFNTRPVKPGYADFSVSVSPLYLYITHTII